MQLGHQLRLLATMQVSVRLNPAGKPLIHHSCMDASRTNKQRKHSVPLYMNRAITAIFSKLLYFEVNLTLFKSSLLGVCEKILVKPDP